MLSLLTMSLFLSKSTQKTLEEPFTFVLGSFSFLSVMDEHTTYFHSMDSVLASLWEQYKLDLEFHSRNDNIDETGAFLPQIAIINQNVSVSEYHSKSNNWIFLDTSNNPFQPEIILQHDCPINENDLTALTKFAEENKISIKRMS